MESTLRAGFQVLELVIGIDTTVVIRRNALSIRKSVSVGIVVRQARSIFG